jgi:hypothetical protein
MLAVNGKTLLLRDKSMENDLHVKLVNDCIALVRRKAGKQIVLDWTISYMAENPDDKRMREHAMGFTFPLTTNIIRDGVTEVWTYYREVKTFGQEKKYWPKKERFCDELMGFSSANADMELLFYMVFISPFCEKIPQLATKQNPNIKNELPAWKLLLPEEEAASAVELGRKDAMIKHKIYNELKFDELVKLAQSFGVTGTQNMQENSLRVALIRMATIDNESMERFLQDFNINPFVELMADVNVAIEKNIIRIDGRMGKPKWCYTKEGGKCGDVIIDVSGAGSEKAKLSLLVDYFKNHPTDYEMLQSKLKPSPKEVKSEIND